MRAPRGFRRDPTVRLSGPAFVLVYLDEDFLTVAARADDDGRGGG